jgi:hypothetical protein
MTINHRTGRASLIVGATFSAALAACVGELAHVDTPIDGGPLDSGGATDSTAPIDAPSAIDAAHDVATADASDAGIGNGNAGPDASDASNVVDAADGGHPADASADAGPGIVVLKTDTSWRLATGGNASVVSTPCVPAVWIAPRENAAWIWSSPCAATDVDSQTFSATFNVGAFSSGELSLAVDNYAYVKINGSPLAPTCTAGTSPSIQAAVCGFTAITMIDVTSHLKAGANTIEITVNNLPLGTDAGPWANPAGVMGWVTIH